MRTRTVWTGQDSNNPWWFRVRGPFIGFLWHWDLGPIGDESSIIESGWALSEKRAHHKLNDALRGLGVYVRPNAVAPWWT